MGTLRTAILLGIVAAACTPMVAVPSPKNAVTRNATGALTGRVSLRDGHPVEGAVVSAWSHFDSRSRDPAHDAVSDVEGRFVLPALPLGTYALTATSQGLSGYSGPISVDALGSSLPIALSVETDGALIAGTVRDDDGKPLRSVRMLAASFSERANEVYVTRTDASGHYAFTIPSDVGYFVAADAPPRPRASQQVDAGVHSLDLAVGAAAAPRPEDKVIAEWLQATATPLPRRGSFDTTIERRFAAIVGSARVVALGESLHGSGSFPDARRRVFELLVRTQGFSVYAMEGGFAETFALDEYVTDGIGDPKAAIAALDAWKDETVETLELVTWMRSYNSDPHNKTKLHIAGFDPYTPKAVTNVVAFLAGVDPPAQEPARATLAPFASRGCDTTYPELPEEKRVLIEASLSALLAKFDGNRDAYTRKAGVRAWRRARQCMRVIQQAAKSYPNYVLRDAQMAENIGWLLDEGGKGSKIVLDAHNAHIAAEASGAMDMGKTLRQTWGESYVAIGFAFGHGSFVALDWRDGKRSGRLATFNLEPAPVDTFDGALGLANERAFVVDLRAARGPLAAWLRSPQRTYSIGGGFDGGSPFVDIAPGRAFDAVIYLDEIQPITPLSVRPE